MTQPAGWESTVPAADDTVILPPVTDPPPMGGVVTDPGPPPQDSTPSAPPAPAPPTSRKARRMAEQSTTDTTEAAAFEPGQLVTYRHPDPITGQDLHGAGVVLHVGEGEGAAVTVAPCSPELLDVLPENLTAGRIGPADSDETEA